MIKVPFFLVFGFNKEPPNKKGKRVLLGSLSVKKAVVQSRRASLGMEGFGALKPLGAEYLSPTKVNLLNYNRFI